MSGTVVETLFEPGRARMRMPEPVDLPALHAIWADPRVMAGPGPVMDTAGSAEARAGQDGFRHEGRGFRAVARREDDKVTGFCGVMRGNPGSPIERPREIGWMPAEPYLGASLCRRSVRRRDPRAWRNVARERIAAITVKRNLESRGLMLRLGMHHVGDGDFGHPSFPDGDPLRQAVPHEIRHPA